MYIRNIGHFAQYLVCNLYFFRGTLGILKVRRDMGVQSPNEAAKAASDPVDHVPPLITVSLITDLKPLEMEFPKPIGRQTLCIVHTCILNHWHCLSGSSVHKFTPSLIHFVYHIRNV